MLDKGLNNVIEIPLLSTFKIEKGLGFPKKIERKNNKTKPKIEKLSRIIGPILKIFS